MANDDKNEARKNHGTAEVWGNPPPVPFRVAGWVKIKKTIYASTALKAWNQFHETHPEAERPEFFREEVHGFCEMCEKAITDEDFNFMLDEEGCYFCQSCWDEWTQSES